MSLMNSELSFDDAVHEAFLLAKERNLPTFQLAWMGRPFGLVHFVKGKYYIHRIPSKHFFRKWGAYGVSRSILQNLKEFDIKVVVLFEHGKTGSAKFGIPVERFFNHEPLLERRNELPPYDVQLFVPLKEWNEETGRWKDE